MPDTIMASENKGSSPGQDKKAAQESKPKRVRTGCLTCRARHLKCDEAMPTCNNCRKAGRSCERGVKLNYQALDCKGLEVEAPRPPEYQLAFLDESREIASEYAGGKERYAVIKDNNSLKSYADGPQIMAPPTTLDHHSLPSFASIQPTNGAEEHPNLVYDHQPRPIHMRRTGPPPVQHHHQHTHSHSDSTYSGSNLHSAAGAYSATEQSSTPSQDKEYLDSQEEVLFMQVFVEEVGLWMDSMDPLKHFSRQLPFHALGEPMLLNAFLACGARHLSLVNPKYSEEKALNYYDTATRFLLSSLQNPNRDTVICATTAVILNVYEIMCERALQRMNHIAGARALIKECGWNAKTTGIGGACFWLNVGMELLSCLHFNWQVAWDPDDWGLDMNMSREAVPNKEELWTYRIVYIVAKVANFRASIPRSADPDPNEEHRRLQHRYGEWRQLKDLADTWNDCIPRTMHPLAYLYPGQTLSGSAFPEVWLIKRTSIVARLFYHTCMCLLAQVNPIQAPTDPEMAELQRTHSQYICGISAHVKDRGVASVALRSLAIAAECLVSRREQEEVLQIFDKIRQETGWRVGFLHGELKEKWGWRNEPQPQAQNVVPMQNGNVTYQQQANPDPAPAPPAQARRPPSGIMNPMYAGADFNLAQHPYQQHYVPANPAYQVANPLNPQNGYSQQNHHGGYF